MRESATGFSRLACIALIILVFSAALNAQDNPPRSVPRIEIGAVLSAANQSDIGNYFHWGGGGRVTLNVTRYLAGEIESTRQPTYIGAPFSPEVHAAITAKGTFRAEQRRWLKFAGLNFFGVIGPGFVNRSVQVEGIPAGLPPGTFCFPYGCTVQRR
jgi:hypothetical protein